MALVVDLALLLFILCNINVKAQVMTVKEAVGPADSIYVAGNPDMYPIEYYNEKDGCYEGILPEILEKISKKIGKEYGTYTRSRNY